MTNPFFFFTPARITAVTLVTLLVAGCSSAPATAVSAPPSPSSAATPADSAEGFAELEKRFDARVGVLAMDTGSGEEVAWRDGERFAYASTIKAVAAAALLDKVGLDGLTQTVPIDSTAIVPYSPVTETRVGGTMTLAEIAEAALTVSDNTAANYLFEALGGPVALDQALSALGDDTTVVSRIEPDLNEATPGDERDTTTPRASATNLGDYLLGDTLTSPERTQLEKWMTATQTGDTLIRADLPTDWIVGDKSGSAGYGTRNDVAIVRPPGRDPIIISVMSSRQTDDAKSDDRLIAEAAALAIDGLGALDDE